MIRNTLIINSSHKKPENVIPVLFTPCLLPRKKNLRILFLEPGGNNDYAFPSPLIVDFSLAFHSLVVFLFFLANRTLILFRQQVT